MTLILPYPKSATLKIIVKVIRHHWVLEWIKQIMMYHHAKFELPSAFHKKYMNVQSCIMSTLMYIGIEHLFSHINPKNAKIVISLKEDPKKGKLCVYICLIYRILYIFNQIDKRNDMTNEYQWHFGSKPHQTTSLTEFSHSLYFSQTWERTPVGTLGMYEDNRSYMSPWVS